jgi:hypothetical protein
MKISRRGCNSLFFVLVILLFSGGWAQAEQNKFWAMELGNYWDYVESLSDPWPTRLQVTFFDTATFPYPTYLVATTEYQGSTWIPMDNRWYEIRENGPNASELSLWQIRSYEYPGRRVLWEHGSFFGCAGRSVVL